MRRAQQIGTHELSSQSVEDCCTLFMPRRPETHARMEAVHAAWNSFDHDAMIDQLVETMEYVDFDQCPSYRPPKSIRAYHVELAPAFTRDNAD
jgi:thiamine biosynthesis protein ThiI